MSQLVQKPNHKYIIILLETVQIRLYCQIYKGESVQSREFGSNYVHQITKKCIQTLTGFQPQTALKIGPHLSKVKCLLHVPICLS